MTDLAIKDVATEVTYNDLIREAFIDSIRNVTVVDDEYPTLKGLLQAQASNHSMGAAQLQSHNTERLLSIISMCHEKYKWSVDVFDGQSPQWGGDDHVPLHLNHSDLIVLDYHLDGEPPADDGSRARQIIAELERSNHFNIVLVHTKGINHDIEAVYNDILREFACIGDSHSFSVSDEIDEDIETWLDDNDVDREQFGFVDNKYDLKDVLRFFECAEEVGTTKTRSPRHLLNAVHDDIASLASESGIQAEVIVKWLVGKEIKRVEGEPNTQGKTDLIWEWDRNDDVNFIATGRVFISVIQKKAEDPELIDKLCQSLYKLNASPMHLLMVKMRHEMDERGLEQANSIIANQHAQAGWLCNLLKNADKNPLEHDKAIDLHWEQIARASKGVLREFSRKLVQAIQPDPSVPCRETVEKFFKNSFKDEDEILGHLNAFSCSMPATNLHLTTGTVLNIEDDLWVCLSPACDLVPGQKRAWMDRIGGEHMVFKAVLLQPDGALSSTNKKAHLNNHVFLNLDGEVQAFTFSKGVSPKWDTFYARAKGCFSAENTVMLDYIRKQDSQGTNFPLIVKNTEAKVIAELRYEYALNLLQRLGANQARVGLDFIKKEGFLADRTY